MHWVRVVRRRDVISTYSQHWSKWDLGELLSACSRGDKTNKRHPHRQIEAVCARWEFACWWWLEFSRHVLWYIPNIKSSYPESFWAILIIRKYYGLVGHLGKNDILSELRKRYWVIGTNSITKSVVSKCVKYHRYSAQRNQQQMLDLSLDRVTPGEPTFSKIVMDYFEPFEIKRRRSILKR